MRETLSRIWPRRHYNLRAQPKRIALASILGGTALLAGCWGGVGPGEVVYFGTQPVVMSYEELRQPIVQDGPKALLKNGKIVLYKQFLLINEPDKGIHIYDNSSPEAPAAIGFLPIPGNTDVVVKNDLLYANSFIDLTVFDISDIDNIALSQRLENTFEPRYDPRFYSVDPEDGIIVGFEAVNQETQQ